MSRVKAPAQRKMIRASVVRRVQTTKNFVTLTIGGPELDTFVPAGFDQCVRLFFRRDGQTGLTMPAVSNNAWIAQFFLTRPSARPWVRNYTVRAFRSDAQEMDIEFALHGDTSPASAFAMRAEPGDPVGIFDEGVGYWPTTDEQLLVADESAVPAVLAILDHAPDDLRADVYLEVPDSADIRPLDSKPGVKLHWLARDGSSEVPGLLALTTVKTADLPEGPLYTWVAGESGLVTGLRRHLVQDRRIPKSDVTFLGYWRHGKASPG
jgi:NADPH-dependent ferric siderophore reductase